MYGTRPLTDEEIQMVLDHFDLSKSECASRDRLFFIVGYRTGFRVSELLSLKIEDLIKPAKSSGTDFEIRDIIYINRKNMKGKKRGRSVPLHKHAKEELYNYIKESGRTSGPLFLSLKKREDEVEYKELRARSAWRIMKTIYDILGFDGKIGCHGMRKTFALRVYENTGKNLLDTQAALGHASVSSTQHYIMHNDESVKNAILSMK